MSGYALRITGASGAGKTTLIERVTQRLTADGYAVASVKSARHHPAPADSPGSDTHRLLEAGAIAGAGLFADGAVIRLPRADASVAVDWLTTIADIVLVEGGHDLDLPALWLESADDRRPGLGDVVATISPTPRPGALHREDVERIAALIVGLAAASRSDERTASLART